MDIQISKADALDEKADLLAVPVSKGARQGLVTELDRRFDGELLKHAERQRFEGEAGSALFVPAMGALKSPGILLVGTGEKGAVNADAIRRLGGHVVKRAREHKAKRVAFAWSALHLGSVQARTAAGAFAEGALLASYAFHAYRKEAAAKAKREAVQSVTCHVEGPSTLVAAMERAVGEARSLAEATCLARDLINTPSGDMGPTELAGVAKGLVKRGSISLKLIDAAGMKKLGMGGALGVAKGSEHPPMGVHLIYKPSKKPKKRVAVVGKAVTFDSGGLSLKPADGMMTMKIDMGGAAAVLGLFRALPELGASVEVHGIFLAVENMPSGSAYRPGDVLTAMNGMTMEVLNTDAEGRITLADALAYAAKQKPDAIIDLATLTGACVTALGEEIAGLMSNDRKLAERLLAAGANAGEDLWELPLHRPYKELIKSKIADLKNIGGRSAGAITAALFLEPFVGGIPWAHLDIAGPVYTEKETRPDQPYGGTGFGVRLLARYLQAL